MWVERRSGLEHQRGSLDHRLPYERDKTRVIHCPAFRRLQRKTQILGTDEGDFHRTRLTHSLEVASIGTSIVRNLMVKQPSALLQELLPTDDLMQVICLLHDIGHPPFGHGGETALHYKMRCFGGFEGNAQTMRLLMKIEDSYGSFGLDLTRRALLGVLKYPVCWDKVVAPEMPTASLRVDEKIRVNDWLPPKGYFSTEQPEIDWLLSGVSEADRIQFQSLANAPHGKKHGCAAHYSFDCSIMDIADDIAYGVHDLEDAVHLRLITREEMESPQLHTLLSQSRSTSLPTWLDRLFDKTVAVRKQAIGEMVNYLITATRLLEVSPTFEAPLLRYNIVLLPEARALLDYLMTSIYHYVIDSQASRTFEFGGQTVVLRLFDALSSNPSHLLDENNRQLFASQSDEALAMRVICDYIANMTDEYAHRMHERLFGLNTRTIFERI